MPLLTLVLATLVQISAATPPPFEPSAVAAVAARGGAGMQKPATPTKPPAPTQPAAPPVAAVLEPAPGNPVVVITTSMGDITLELFKARAPASAANFLQYVDEQFYPGTIFHRVVKNFVVQGGGYTADMSEKPTRPPILNEAFNGLRNTRGSLAMARTRALRSATSQFYINVSANTALDHRDYSPEGFGYAVFGRVLSGMDVVDKIAAVPTRAENPVEAVTIVGARVKRR